MAAAAPPNSKPKSWFPVIFLPVWSGGMFFWGCAVLRNGRFTTGYGTGPIAVTPTVHPWLFWFSVGGAFFAGTVGTILTITQVVGVLRRPR